MSIAPTIGVRGRLLGALALNGLVAFAIALGAYAAFDGLHGSITTVTAERFPAVVASARLERQHQRIMRTLEELALSADNLERGTVNQSLSDQFATYERMLDEFPAPRLGETTPLLDQHEEIRRLRELIDTKVAARIIAARSLQEQDRVAIRIAGTLDRVAPQLQADPDGLRWLVQAERLLFLAASVRRVENRFAMARLSADAQARHRTFEELTRALPSDLAGLGAPLAGALGAVVDGPSSVFRHRLVELEAEESLRGLLERANQVSLLVTGLTTGAFVEQTNLADESRQQVIDAAVVYTRLFFLLACVVLVGAGVAFVYVQRRIVGRLLAVQQALRQPADGARVQIPVFEPDEIGELARALRFYIHETEVKGEALRRNERWLRATLEEAPVPLIVSGRDDGQVRFLNKRAADLLGMENGGPFRERPAASLWRSEEDLGAFVRRIVDHGAALDIEAELVTEAGTPFWGLVSGIVLQFQGEDVLLIALVDITRRREAEELVRHTQAFLDAVIDNVPSILYVLEETSGRVVLWNRAAEDVFGAPRERVCGSTLADALGSAVGAALAPADTADAPGGAREVELRAAGTSIVLAVRHHPFGVSRDGQRHVIGVASDVTAFRRAGEELREAKERAERADLAKTHFLATVSHEMRTPLNGILGLGRLMLNGPLGDTERRYAESIMRCGTVLLDQVNNILDLRKVEDGKLDLDPVPCLLGALLEDVLVAVEPLAAEKAIDLRLSVDAGVPPAVVVDPRRLHQIMTNLVGNAVKFTEKGWVELAVRHEPGSAAGHGRLVVCVRDTGIGIPGDRQDAIFDPLEQADPTIARRFGGSGLGLAIVRHLVAAMDGTVAVDSAPGRGSTFTVAIPMVAADPADVPTRTGRIASARFDRPLDLLLVEDDAINREVAVGLMGDAGHRLTVAETGERALALAAEQRYDAILLDIHLPDVEGVEVARRIRALPDPVLAGVPIVAVTANVFAEDRVRYLAAGIDGIVEKPIVPERLLLVLSGLPTDGGADAAQGGAGPSAAQAATVDDAVLERYRSQLGPARFATIRRLLVEAGRDGTARLADPAVDDAEAEDVAHRLAGAAGHFGLTGFVAAMRRIEDAIRYGRPAAAAADRAAAPGLFDAALAALDRASQNPPANFPASDPASDPASGVVQSADAEYT